jgi:hypothetical protein
MSKYLQLYQYYADLYDRHTVDICRRIERQSNDEKIDIPEGQNITKALAIAMQKWACEMMIHFETGERYLQRESTIKEWMDRDLKKDELYGNAQPPEGIRCLTCRNQLKVNIKELWMEMDKPDRVLFMFECPNRCLPRRAFFSDGEEWRTKPTLCLKCNSPLNTKREKSEGKIIIIGFCSKCDYSEKEVIDLTSSKQEDDFDENFPQDRDRFCLNEEDGKKFQEEKWHMQQSSKFIEDWKEKEKAQKEKLKQNPGGYHLKGVGYTCAICHNHTLEGDNWYDEYGIKCLVCQKAIDEGEIPPTVASDKESWYTKYDLESRFNVKSATLRKWVKEGIIKPRHVSYYGKGVHYEFFMIADNKDFLPPKNMVASRSVKERKDGKDYYTSYPWYRFVDPMVYLKSYKIVNYMKMTQGGQKK